MPIPWLWVPKGTDCECVCDDGVGCPCEHSSTGKIPNCVDATIAGMVDDQCACDCTLLNTTYRIARSSGCTLEGGLCLTTRPVALCNYKTLTVVVSESGGTYYITATASDGAGATIVWKKSYASKPNCTGWSSESLPYDSQTGTSYCDASSSTLSLTVAPVSQECDDPCTTVACDGACSLCSDCTPVIEASFPVFANRDCSDCDELNNLSPIVIPWNAARSSASHCTWWFDLQPLVICGDDQNLQLTYIKLEVVSGSPNYLVLLTLGYWRYYPSIPRVSTWSTWIPETGTDSWDCNTSLSNLVLSGGQNPPTPRPCDFLTTTVTINSVFA